MNSNFKYILDTIIKINGAYSLLKGYSWDTINKFSGDVKNIFTSRESPIEFEDLRIDETALNDASKYCLELLCGFFNLYINSGEATADHYKHKINTAKDNLNDVLTGIKNLPAGGDNYIDPKSKEKLLFDISKINIITYSANTLKGDCKNIFDEEKINLKHTINGVITCKIIDFPTIILEDEFVRPSFGDKFEEKLENLVTKLTNYQLNNTPVDFTSDEFEIYTKQLGLELCEKYSSENAQISGLYYYVKNKLYYKLAHLKDDTPDSEVPNKNLREDIINDIFLSHAMNNEPVKNKDIEEEFNSKYTAISESESNYQQEVSDSQHVVPENSAYTENNNHISLVDASSDGIIGLLSEFEAEQSSV